MAVYTSLELADAQALGRAVGLDVVATEGLAAGSVNSNHRVSLRGGGQAFVRVYEEQAMEGAVAEADLLRHLAAGGVPVVTPLADPPLSYRGKPVQVFPWAPGVHRCQRGVTAGDAHAVGRALAAVHQRGAPALRPSRFDVAGLVGRTDVIATAVDPELARRAGPLREALEAAQAERHPAATRGLVHGDLFRDNVLFDGERISALLDFESAAEGVLAFDLAVTWLAWCFGDDLDRDLSRALFGGYQTVRPLPEVDRDALFAEARLAALRFTVTRITDYAMRAHLGANVPRDHRRFEARLARLDGLGAPGILAFLGLR